MALGVALLVSGCAGSEPASAPAAPSAAPSEDTNPDQDAAPAFTGTVTIGVIAPTQGGFVEIGSNIIEGAKLAAEHINADGGAGGLEVIIEVRDEGMQPELATQAVRDLVNEGVDLLAGFLSSVDCNAVAPLVDELGAVLMISTCAADGLTGAVSRGPSKFERVFAVSTRDSMQAPSLGLAVGELFPDVTSVYKLGYDYVVGRELAGGFVKGFSTKANFTVADEYWVPLGEANFRPQVQALLRGAGADVSKNGLVLATFGAGTAGVLQQGLPLGLADRFAFLAQSGGYIPVARSLEGTAPEVWNAYEYYPLVFDNAANTRFVTDFQAAQGRLPVTWSYQGYQAVKALAAAIALAGSGEADAVLAALKSGNVTFDSPSGQRRIDGVTHQADTPVVVTQTVGDVDGVENLKLIDSFVIQQDDALNALAR